MIIDQALDYIFKAGPTIVALGYGVLRIETRLRRIEILCKSRGDSCSPPPTKGRLMTLDQQDSAPE